MSDVGRIIGASGNQYNVQPKEVKGMPKTHETIFSSSKVLDMQAYIKACMRETKEKNPLNEKAIVPFKKGEYPLGGKQILGPSINAP